MALRTYEYRSGNRQVHVANGTYLEIRAYLKERGITLPENPDIELSGSGFRCGFDVNSSYFSVETQEDGSAGLIVDIDGSRLYLSRLPQEGC